MLDRCNISFSYCLGFLLKELDDLRERLQPLMIKYKKEKERIDEIWRLKQKREELLVALQEAERRYD
ncbi:hypothetical protein L2E82_40080 [Cichorium intybus]|uniref:Uncharacterized protein n=1 Tax=Cichorium intybus TaxID=13427 RepID=A0ACB9AJB4_CICIN|nr:hypothetical protein L2E82_40080 [Cichorium intybus]